MTQEQTQELATILPQDKFEAIFGSGIEIEKYILPSGNFFSRLYEEQKEYFKQLKSRQVETSIFDRISMYAATLTSASRHMLLWVFLSIAVSVIGGTVGSCGGLLSYGCGFSKFEQTKIHHALHSLKQPNELAGGNTSENTPNITTTPSDQLQSQADEISVKELSGHKFNVAAFQALLVTFAFILAFTRWQIGNRQSGMSELFERKKEVNLLILGGDSKLKQLVSGATSFKHSTQAQNNKTITPEECRAYFNEITYNKRKASDIDFDEKMFTFLELDNLEFAFSKYKSGLLDAEQMYRSCEIFESRCLNEDFRYLAAMQGFSFYTEDFHRVLGSLLVRGYFFSQNQKNADDETVI
ncbi:hypothetical protein [Kordiimonas marina]|uniref:hypothetical protein n=1 Tax=Kordiimonas marina TaxID=2872312 RepID=UPI001FF59724|nr:hypothetical protein [Kordiimonas marina]MCJ9430746.1 hypothetical protein [Kordiimonas marina]